MNDKIIKVDRITNHILLKWNFQITGVFLKAVVCLFKKNYNKEDKLKRKFYEV